MEAIQLIAIAKTNDIRNYDVDLLLQPFVDEINTLLVCLLNFHFKNNREAICFLRWATHLLYMEMSNGYLGLWLHFVETLLQAISWVDIKELEEHLESVVDVLLVIQTYKTRYVYSICNANNIQTHHQKVIFHYL